MTVNKYRTELNEDKLNILVRESSAYYDFEGEFSSPEKIVDLMNSLYNMRNLAEEYVYALAVDTRCKIIGVFEISHGTATCSVVNPREIFIRLLLCGASKFFLVHNHPSGSTHPSKEDITLTERVNDAGKLIGLDLLDHIIIGDTYFSFSTEKYI